MESEGSAISQYQESEAIYAQTMSYTFQWLNDALSAEAYAKKLDDFLKLVITEDD
ncbi:MAG: hypothetical protein RR975_11170 [Clostridia bacterium]